MDQEFMDEIDLDLLDNGPGDPPFIRLAKAEQQVRELTATNRRLEAELAEARKDGERLDWLAEKAKQSYTGVSIDSYRVTMEEESWRGWGWRLMWHHHSERVDQTLRAAIDAARGAK